MNDALQIGGGLAAGAVVVAVALGRGRERRVARELEEGLLGGTTDAEGGVIEAESLARLPSPVARYFRHVLPAGQEVVRSAVLQQAGVVRSSLESERWSAFTAREVLVPGAPGFVWNAKVRLGPGLHVRVLDSYAGGKGSGRVSLQSVLALASETGGAELSEGALHRYLAEAVWCPAALLPQCGVEWTAIDGERALATLSDAGTTVSLEFRFNELGEVESVHSPGRWQRTKNGYQRVPWEGRFGAYERRDGIRIPVRGEAGWQVEERFVPVWRGEILEARYR